MSVFLLKRLATLVATLLAASIVVFLVLEVLPGDAAQMMMGPDSSPEAVHALSVKRGLYRPRPSELQSRGRGSQRPSTARGSSSTRACACAVGVPTAIQPTSVSPGPQNAACTPGSAVLRPLSIFAP